MCDIKWAHCESCGALTPNSTQCNTCMLETQSLVAPEGMHRCPMCGVLVSDERFELRGVDECVKCTVQKNAPVGVWDYPEGFHERNEGVGGLLIVG